jgi:hypothetical protein
VPLSSHWPGPSAQGSDQFLLLSSIDTLRYQATMSDSHYLVVIYPNLVVA